MSRIDRIAEPWGTRAPYGPGDRWPVRVDTYLDHGLTEDDVDRWVQSATILHSNGDGLDTKRCHPDDLRQARWANGKLKEAATQILVS